MVKIYARLQFRNLQIVMSDGLFFFKYTKHLRLKIKMFTYTYSDS